MIVPRTPAALAALLALAVPVAPVCLAPPAAAAAHGATAQPPSRAVVCAPDAGRAARSAACRAAVAATGREFDEWDNVRVSGVAGRDRAVVPDGRVCSGGLAEFRGLDLARGDWPATRMAAGARFTFRYRQRIPHRGTFELYVTRPGYDPAAGVRGGYGGSRRYHPVADPRGRGEG
jgi:chitin-binding protein